MEHGCSDDGRVGKEVEAEARQVISRLNLEGIAGVVVDEEVDNPFVFGLDGTLMYRYFLLS